MYQDTPSRNTTLSLPAGMYGDGYSRLMRNGAVVQQGGARLGVSGLGMTAQEIADLIKTTTSATLPLLIANNPGTRLETRADGSIVVYNQPTGTTATLPGGFTSGPSGNAGNGGAINVGLGPLQASASGLKTENLVMIGLAAVAIIALMKK